MNRPTIDINTKKIGKSPKLKKHPTQKSSVPSASKVHGFPTDGMIAVNQIKADVVYADPPWNINQKGHRGADQHYDLMTLDQIKAMPVADLCKENAVCFLWVTGGAPCHRAGEEVLKAWGFDYKEDMIWVKPMMGMGGNVLRYAFEPLMIGIKGKKKSVFRAQPNWEFLPRQEHSHKPEEMYAVIERLFPGEEYLELFARKRPSNPKWFIWGNEAEGGSDVFIPGYPVPEYSGRVLLAKEGDDIDSSPDLEDKKFIPFYDTDDDIFTDEDIDNALKEGASA